MKNTEKKIRRFGEEGRKGLVYILSANPVDDPTSGSGICHRDWATALQELGYDVVIVESNNKDNGLAAQVPYKIRSIAFDGRNNNPDYSKNPSQYESFKSLIPFNYLAFLAATRSSLQFVQTTPQILEAYLNSFAWAFRSASLIYGAPDVSWNGHAWVQNYVTLGVPTIFTVHGTEIAKNMGGREKRYQQIVHRAVDNAYRGVAISDQEYKNIVEYGLDTERAEVMYNGFNDHNFNPDRGATKSLLKENFVGKDKKLDLTRVDGDAPWIVFAGRAAHFKGLDNLIEALPLVHEKYPNAQLLIFGSGDHSRIEIQGADPINHFELVKKLGVEDRVHFLGPISQPVMADLISISDAYVLPSRNEPFGLVAIEGMATGKPPILTKSGGFIDIVSKYTGKDPREMEETELAVARMVEAEDASHDDPAVRLAAKGKAVSSLADAIVAELSQDEQKRAQRSKEATRFAFENFSIRNRVKERMVPLIEKAKVDGYRSPNWGLDKCEDKPNRKRQERLEKIAVNDSLARAFEALRKSANTPGFAGAWGDFDREATRYFGSAEFLHTLDMDAMPDYRLYPNAIFSELSRASGVTQGEFLSVMKLVEKTPWNELVNA